MTSSDPQSDSADTTAQRPVEDRFGFARFCARCRTRMEPFMQSRFGTILNTAFDIARNLWNRRIRFSYAFYAVVFTIVTVSATLLLQWSVYAEPTYADPNAVDTSTKAWNSIAGQLTKFVVQVWLFQQRNALLNFLVLGLIYLVLVFLFNRFWIATAVFSSVMLVFAVANHIKVALRSEPIIPSDLSFLSGGNTGEIWSFIPQDDLALVHRGGF